MSLRDFSGVILGLFLAFLLTQLLVYGVSGIGLFAYDNAPMIIVKPDYTFYNLGVYISGVLWGNCGINVLVQAIVLFASAMGVIALLREEVKH